LEKFAARKANNFSGHKDFLTLNGTTGQVENTVGKVDQENELLAFKCLHYSVTESSGYVEVTVISNNVQRDITFGLRTVEITAKAPHEFTAIDQTFTLKKREDSINIPISIIDNSDWQPDLEFKVELYDIETKEKLFGGDTETKITILDEDFPGKLGFSSTDVQASKFQDKVEIKICRTDGASGKISCMIRTEQLTESGKAA